MSSLEEKLENDYFWQKTCFDSIDLPFRVIHA